MRFMEPIKQLMKMLGAHFNWTCEYGTWDWTLAYWKSTRGKVKRMFTKKKLSTNVKKQTQQHQRRLSGKGRHWHRNKNK